jgi:hypothetical protein
MQTTTRVSLNLEEKLRRLGRSIDEVMAGAPDVTDPAFWKAKADELEVQTALGRMELRDRLVPLMKRIQSELQKLSADIEQLSDTEPIHEQALSEAVQESLRTLSTEMPSAEELQ